MIGIKPSDVSIKEVLDLLLGGVGPRPIALVSTLSADGILNLAPFSFFNAFGANPPIIAFSCSRRVRDNTVKDTYNNLVATNQCVVQAVTHAMVQQVSLASAEWLSETDEFVKSGLTPLASDLIAVPRVKESPFQMECRLDRMIELGGRAGSGNLAICEVLKFHLDDDLYTDGVIHPDKIDLVARMSGDYYCHARGEAIFTVEKPTRARGIGYDCLPDFIKTSDDLTANNLAQLAGIETLPTEDDVRFWAENQKQVQSESQSDYQNMFKTSLAESQDSRAGRIMMQAARQALAHDDIIFAWNAILYSHMITDQ